MDNLVIPTPEFELTLPISREKVQYRPFLVREERMMMVLKESTDTTMIIQNLKKIVANCIISDFDVNTLSYTDFEYLFLKMRVRSMGEHVDFKTTCESCGKMTPIEVDLNAICEKVEGSEVPEGKVMLTDDIGVMLSPLRLRDAATASALAEKDSVQAVLVFIDKVFTKDAVYNFHESSPSDRAKFIDSLSMKHVDLILAEVSKYPKLETTEKVTCANCGATFDFHAEGLETFFT